LFDRIVYDRWAAAGSRTLKDRVRAKVAALRAEEPPYGTDDAARQELAQLLRAAEEQRLAAET
jgi:trimethylamine:corrinoid methyltransferase-like protein